MVFTIGASALLGQRHRELADMGIVPWWRGLNRLEPLSVEALVFVGIAFLLGWRWQLVGRATRSRSLRKPDRPYSTRLPVVVPKQVSERLPPLPA